MTTEAACVQTVPRPGDRVTLPAAAQASRELAHSATSSEARPCPGLVSGATFRSGTGEGQEEPHARADGHSVTRTRASPHSFS